VPPEVVEVTDPFHPLFGKRLELVAVTRPRDGRQFVLVRYAGTMQLRIPVLAIGPGPLEPRRPHAKLSFEAVEDLLAFVKEYEACPIDPRMSGTVFPKRSSRESPRSSH
jgi:hypothetical protein